MAFRLSIEGLSASSSCGLTGQVWPWARVVIHTMLPNTPPSNTASERDRERAVMESLHYPPPPTTATLLHYPPLILSNLLTLIVNWTGTQGHWLQPPVQGWNEKTERDQRGAYSNKFWQNGGRRSSGHPLRWSSLGVSTARRNRAEATPSSV